MSDAMKHGETIASHIFMGFPAKVVEVLGGGSSFGGDIEPHFAVIPAHEKSALMAEFGLSFQHCAEGKAAAESVAAALTFFATEGAPK